MGYQVKASAYLLKSQLTANLENVMDVVLTERKINQNAIEITVDNCTISLPLHQIEYIESRGRTAIFHGEMEYHTYMRLSDVEAILASKSFLRIHRCYIVNPAHCIMIKNYQAILDTGEIWALAFAIDMSVLTVCMAVMKWYAKVAVSPSAGYLISMLSARSLLLSFSFGCGYIVRRQNRKQEGRGVIWICLRLIPLYTIVGTGTLTVMPWKVVCYPVVWLRSAEGCSVSIFYCIWWSIGWSKTGWQRKRDRSFRQRLDCTINQNQSSHG